MLDECHKRVMLASIGVERPATMTMIMYSSMWIARLSDIKCPI